MAFSSEGSLTCHTYCDKRPRSIRSHPKVWHPRPTVGFKSGTQGSPDLCASALTTAPRGCFIYWNELKKSYEKLTIGQNTVFGRKLSHQDVVSVTIKMWKIKVPKSNQHRSCFILNMHINSYNILQYSNVSSGKTPFLSFSSWLRTLHIFSYPFNAPNLWTIYVN
jgi:hypothetical protein